MFVVASLWFIVAVNAYYEIELIIRGDALLMQRASKTRKKNNKNVKHLFKLNNNPLA